ncbi:Hydrogenase/urease accessory protein HupE [Rhizobiales bacterium GAS113]|nr:Hydrogenase/urease accessory protein HupE [Rhizobiales bacterium GAS113]
MRGGAGRFGRARIFAPVFLALSLGAGEAQAHLVTTGVGPFYDGVVHFVLTPEDLLPVAALAVLAALRGPAHGRLMLFTLPTIWLGAGIAGWIVGGKTSEILPAAASLALGLLIAIDVPLPIWCSVGIAALVASTLGYADGSGLPPDGGGALILLGIVAAVFTAFAFVAALALSLRSRVARIAMRISGSWIAASGLLLLGWLLRGAFRSST